MNHHTPFVVTIASETPPPTLGGTPLGTQVCAEAPPLLSALIPGRPFTRVSRTGTGIEWANHTWNPWVGCSKTSEGCEHCYAITAAAACARRGQKHYAGLTKKLKNGILNWTGKIAEAPLHIVEKPLGLPAGSLVFVCSMADFGHPDAPDRLRLRVLDIMRMRPDIAFLAPTKRPAEILAFLARTGLALPDNLWIGVTVESSAQLDRIDTLRAIPAAIRFLSIEPLLDDVAAGGLDLTGTDWVIVGGESGKGKRPMAAQWARHVRDACVAHGVPFFMKQWGKWRSNPLARDERGGLRKSREVERLDPHGTGGALLDGQLWREMPAAYWQRWALLYKPKRRLRLIQTSSEKPGANEKIDEGCSR